MTVAPPVPTATNVEPSPVLYWVLITFGICIIIALLYIAFRDWSIPVSDAVSKDFSIGPGVLIAAVAYLVLSLKMVGLDEIAGAFFWGRALVYLNAGLQFAPLGLIQVGRETRTVIEFQAPGEPEKVFKGDDKDPLPEKDMVRPIRAVTRAPKEDEQQILDTQMTLSFNFVVQYSIREIFDYIANFGTKENIQTQLRDIGEATLSESVTAHTPRTFIEALPTINEQLAVKIRERFLNSGVEIISVRLISPDITHDVSTALAGIPKARADAQSVMATAEGDKVKLTRAGEGNAAATLADLNARTEGRKKMMEELKVDGATIIAGETVRDLSDKTDVIIAGAEGGMRDLMGLVMGAKSALDKKDGGTA